MAEDVLMLSISGLRGLTASTLRPPVAERYVRSFLGWLKKHKNRPAPRLVIGRDGRPSGVDLMAVAARAVRESGGACDILDVATTPAVGVMVDHRKADAGLVITASHNPSEWNGIKILLPGGSAPTAEEARQIAEAFAQEPEITGWKPAAVPPTTLDAGREHVSRILARVDAARIAGRKLRVVLDSVCGAGGPSTALLLEKLGVETIHLNAQPTGLFPHPPEPTETNLAFLGEEVRRHKADLGLAQDPDADRLALLDETGRYIGEEYTLVLAAWRILQKTPGPLAANLSTSRMIDDLARRFGAPMHRTPVGEAHVAARMRAEKAVIGGEGNGGVIWPVISYVRDSLSAAALVLELLAEGKEPLSRRVAGLPAYVIRKDKLPVRPGLAEKAIAAVAGRFKNDRIDRQDGIRVDTPRGWVHVRASNTEPILRLIAEAADAPAADALLGEVKAIVQTL